MARPNAIDFLGGRRVMGNRVEEVQVRDAVRKGLPYAALDALADALAMGQGDLTEVVGLSRRTTARRRNEGQLSPIESDRLYRVAHIAELAVETLGGLREARVWLSRPNRALAGEVPLHMLDTEIGQQRVQEVLLRLGHGIHS
jgi:putative toxin-antitoxin system antitoxin component (TIGR02293 family)